VSGQIEGGYFRQHVFAAGYGAFRARCGWRRGGDKRRFSPSRKFRRIRSNYHLLRRIRPFPAVFRPFGLLQRTLLYQRLQAADGQPAINYRFPAFYSLRHGRERLYGVTEPVQALFVKPGEYAGFEAMTALCIRA
jgi:hypothetical protein